MEPVKRTAWTQSYRPFILGGSCHYLIVSELLCHGPFALGKGFIGYTTVAPDGHVFVVEAKTGGLIGNAPTQEEALKVVRGEVHRGKKMDMRAQLKSEAARFISMTKEQVTPEEFWTKLKRNIS